MGQILRFFGQQHLHNHQHQRQNPHWHFHPALSGYHIITSQSHITQQPEPIRGCDWLKAVFLFGTETEAGTLSLKVTFRNVPSHQELDGAALHEDGEEDHGEGGGQEELLVPAGVVKDRRQGKPNCSSFFSREVRSHSQKK